MSLVFHIPLLFLGPVNLEFAFADLVKYFKNGNEVLLNQFLYYQANTVGISFLGYLLNIESLGINEILLIRLLNLTGSVVFVLSVIRITKYFEIENIFFITLFIIVSPLFWTFTSRATADLLPAALVLLSYSFFLKNSDCLYIFIVSALIFGISLIIKPIIIFMYIFFVGLYFVNKKIFTLSKIISFCLISFLTFIVFLLQIFLSFDFFITSNKFWVVVLKQGIYFGANNFILYTGYVMFAVLPMIIMGKFYRNLIKYSFISIIFFAVIFIFGCTFITDTGEMSFSFIELIIPKSFLNGFLMVGTMIFLSSNYFNQRCFNSNYKKKINKYFFYSVVVSLFFLSFIRPSQRYILALLPFCLLLLPEANYKNKRLLYTFAFFLFSINLVISINQYLRSSASKDILSFIMDNQIIAETDPGSITGSYGNYFYNHMKEEKKYIVVNYTSTDSFFSSSRSFLFIKHDFSLVKLNNKI